MKIVVCDQCSNQLESEDEVYATIALPSEGQWQVVDLCSAECVALTFGLIEEEIDDMEEDVAKNDVRSVRLKAVQEELPLDEEIEIEEISEPEFKERDIDPDTLVDNEKRFKEQAREITRNMTNVRSTTQGDQRLP